MRLCIAVICILAGNICVKGADLWVEAESFAKKGGWVLDQQFMDVMGSPYLLAHGLGEPVADAETKVAFPETGDYYVYVRTYNWTSPWEEGEGPGKFTLNIDGERVSSILGADGNQWMWQMAGKVKIRRRNSIIRLHDLTGFDGRCDAIYFTTDVNQIPPSDPKGLEAFRRKSLHLSDSPFLAGKFDLVVVGGGIAGISAAVAAARLSCKVALVNDRPVLGGNNSSEVRVHLSGRIGEAPYKELGNLQKEFAPSRGGNAQPEEYYEDDKKEAFVTNEPNITLFAKYHAINVQMKDHQIQSVVLKNIETSKEIALEAPLFVDCTGDGTIGYLAGADYRMGRESRSEYGESNAPEKADQMTMGASVQWYSEETKHPSPFPRFSYGIEFNEANCEKVTMGEWNWETGMNRDQMRDFEQIRDYGMLVIYSNWSFLKNQFKENESYKNRKLGWVAYISGKRESRRLLGDYVLKEDDIRRYIIHEDAAVTCTWSIDLHYPDPENSKSFPNQEFKSIAPHQYIYPYPLPYRCLYSRNVNNLFMAGRDISVTHVALGAVRVQRTTGMMGEVVGMAASICKKHQVLPRDVYQRYFDELKVLMCVGVGKPGVLNNQQYNLGYSLEEKPRIE